MSYYGSFDWSPYVSVAERRRNAEREMQKLRKKGHPVSPVVIDGRTIAKTFWGKAWCDNLERYSDYENRVPRGRTYVRNGSVVDLQIAPGAVSAWVSGSELYRVTVKVSTLPNARWGSICADCAGAIDSLVELLQGRFSKGVMERICQQKTGLFPAPTEIQFDCSCPDSASMCKHIAAALYGVGARLDEKPELLFRLRKVDEKELIAKAGKGLSMAKKGPAQVKVLAENDLAAMFGLDLGGGGEGVDSAPEQRTSKPTRKVSRKIAPIVAKVATRPVPASRKKETKKSMVKARPRSNTSTGVKAKAEVKTATKAKGATKPKVKAKVEATPTLKTQRRVAPKLRGKAKS